jgi:alpha-galactosidase
MQGFGEPAEGWCDGFQRINSESHSGGIAGIFRHNSAEGQRIATIQFLDPTSTYDVLRAPDGEKIIRATGKELKEKGFLVKSVTSFDGSLYEVCRIK